MGHIDIPLEDATFEDFGQQACTVKLLKAFIQAHSPDESLAAINKRTIVQRNWQKC